MDVIDVGKEFYHRLANRDENQGDGLHTAREFRRRFLHTLDDKLAWDRAEWPAVALDFANVRKIGPSFANEAFAYFTKYAKPDTIMSAIDFQNLTKIQRMIITQELQTGYHGR